jgi:hypothetical protein
MIDKNEIRREFLRQAIPPTPTPDIVQRCKECASACDRCQYTHEEAATTIEALREAVRVLGEYHSARRSLELDMSRVNLHRLNLAEAAVDANPIARAACQEKPS